tara:strand:- start:99 stop:203 length:105 start_codon:yes stop_codon:yes gene_type:complete
VLELHVKEIMVVLVILPQLRPQVAVEAAVVALEL